MSSFSEEQRACFREMPPMLQRVMGCLVGVAIGDAFGMPWELCSHEEIQELTSGKGVTGLQDIPAGKQRKIPDLRQIKLGETTDDWMLTRVVAESLIRCRGVDLYDQALAHVGAYETSTLGWGGTTKDSIAELKQWFDSRGRQGRSPLVPAHFTTSNRGTGNGVLMKIAPVACMLQLGGASLAPLASIRGLEQLTHGDTNAVGIVSFLIYCLRESFSSRMLPITEVLLADANLGLNRVGHEFENEVSPEQGFPSAAHVREVFGTSSRASESGPFSVATMLRHQQDFRGGILEAINAGGDTDTNAAIVGAMIGAQVGFDGIPADWIDQIPDAQVAMDVAHRLYKTFARTRADSLPLPQSSSERRGIFCYFRMLPVSTASNALPGIAFN